MGIKIFFSDIAIFVGIFVPHNAGFTRPQTHKFAFL